MKKIILWIIVIASFLIAIPWSLLGFPGIDEKIGEYKLGLDLHGGVELDYLIDFSSIPDLTPERKTQIIEDMKTILDSRVRRVGTTEPNLNTALYGDETHIIIQIPTPNNAALSAEEREKQNATFITEAKSVIGQVIKIQFKEPRSTEEFSTLQSERPEIINKISESYKTNTLPFDAWGQKIADTYENVFMFTDADLSALLGKGNLILSDLAEVFSIENIPTSEKTAVLSNVQTNLGTQTAGTSFVIIESLEDTLEKSSPVKVRMLFVHKDPLQFRPALGKNGEVLDERFLINTMASPDPTTGQYVVSLVFNTEGQKMFGDITERNAGGTIAIFLWNSLLTAPSVSGRIDGNAIITSGWELDSKTWATDLSRKINEGIVPVGIYEHSERTIGPNLGKASLQELSLSGLIGLIAICMFLLWRYHSSGIVASVSLIIYVFILLALVRILWVTLTLSGVAGIVLSIGIAIDSNILLLERVKDFLGQGKDMRTSLRLGFQEAWSAVWDSNITSLFVWLILWWMWVSLIKGFGQMTVLGIIVSLLVVKYICNPLTIWLRNKIG